MKTHTIQKLVLISLFALSASVFSDEKINWAGPYAGIELGYADSNIKLKCKDCNLSTYSDYRIGDTNTQNIKNVIYGAQVGYNFVQNNFLYGAELSYLNLNSHEKTWSEATPAHDGNARDDTFTSKIGSTLSLSGRLGKVYDNFLVYGKAGVVLSDYSLKIQDYNTKQDGSLNNNGTGGGKDSKWLPGLSVGLGAEYMLNSKIGVGAEYNYTHLFSRDLSSGGDVIYIMSTDNFDIHLAQLKLNYHF
jgi:opacity protein-like surface antigen